MEQQEIIETQKRIIDTISYGVTDAIIITDPERKITHFNKAAEIVTGHSVVGALNQPLETILKLADDEKEIPVDTFCPVGDVDIHGVIYEGEGLKILDRDEEENIVNVRTQKVKGGVEMNLGSIIFIDDTFQKSELERMKLDFVSMAEHVLRTPVTIIRGYISRLLEDNTASKLEEVERGYLNSAFLATTDLLGLVEDLLNIAEFRRGHVKINAASLNIEGLVSKVVDEFKLVAADKGLSVVFIPPLYSLPMVNADISKLHIVLQNFIENAIKYTKEGKVEVILSKPDDNNIQVAVKDSGRGIPQEYIDNLFSKFYRVKRALEMEYGLGLGLYISKKIIDAHGGKVWVESTEEDGSTFFFSLPIVVEEVNESEI
ncbi:ATP-binding protein [Patescibacteria group bacterium]